MKAYIEVVSFDVKDVVTASPVTCTCVSGGNTTLDCLPGEDD